MSIIGNWENEHLIDEYPEYQSYTTNIMLDY